MNTLILAKLINIHIAQSFKHTYKTLSNHSFKLMSENDCCKQNKVSYALCAQQLEGKRLKINFVRMKTNACAVKVKLIKNGHILTYVFYLLYEMKCLMRKWYIFYLHYVCKQQMLWCDCGEKMYKLPYPIVIVYVI